jgi:hypothetical protein
MNPGEEPIDPEEELFRRIPDSTGWYRPGEIPPLEPEAFRANENDTSGVSIWRAKYTTLKDASAGRPGKVYWVAVLRARDVIHLGIEVEPRPVSGGPGHAELSSLTYEDRKSRQAIEWRIALVNIVLRIEGPFFS